MHHMQKKAAAKKYGPLLIGEDGEQKVSEAMKADQFTEEEIGEVIFEIKSQPNDGEQAPPPPPPPVGSEGILSVGPGNPPPPAGSDAPPPPVVEAPKTKNKVYEEFRVQPEFEAVHDAMGKMLGQKLKSFRKLDTKPVKTTSITEERAEDLNAQSINSGFRLYLKQ